MHFIFHCMFKSSELVFSYVAKLSHPVWSDHSEFSPGFFNINAVVSTHLPKKQNNLKATTACTDIIKWSKLKLDLWHTFETVRQWQSCPYNLCQIQAFHAILLVQLLLLIQWTWSLTNFVVQSSTNSCITKFLTALNNILYCKKKIEPWTLECTLTSWILASVLGFRQAR